MPKSKEKSKEKRPKKSGPDIRERILDAALDVASTAPWEVVSLYEIAETAAISHGDMADVFPTKEALVSAISGRLDAAVIVSTAIDEDGSLRDKLFDVFMEKFDHANSHRAAVISIMRSFGWDKPSTCAQINTLHESCTRLAIHAGMDVHGIIGRGQVVILSLALVPVWWKWMHDESPDLAATMASLDKALGHFEKFAIYTS